jgi:hypothetical protein
VLEGREFAFETTSGISEEVPGRYVGAAEPEGDDKPFAKIINAPHPFYGLFLREACIAQHSVLYSK